MTISISPGEARTTIAAIGEAMRLVSVLENRDDKLPRNVYNTLLEARRELSVYVSDEWDKTKTIENGAD